MPVLEVNQETKVGRMLVPVGANLEEGVFDLAFRGRAESRHYR